MRHVSIRIMQERTFYVFLITCFYLVVSAGPLAAQSITTNSVSPNATCGNAAVAVTVSFATTGTFSATTVFTAQLSAPSGTFPGNPTTVGTVTGAGRTINGTIPANLPASATYRIRVISNASAGAGTASTITFAVRVTARPDTEPVALCQGQAATPLTATPASGGTLNWYGTSATGGTASSVPPVPSTNAVGSTNYYVSQSVNGCESDRSRLVVIVNPTPAAPTAPTPATLCEGATANALTANGQNLRWYGTNATGGTGSSTPTVPNTGAAGTTNYYVSQTVNGCESARTAIAVTVNDSPATPAVSAAPSYCQNQTATALSATPSGGGTLNWYGASATGGTASRTPTVPNTGAAGTTNYYVSQTVNGCESSRASIPVVIKPTPVAPTVTNTIACQNRPASALTATPSSGGTINWYSAATGGTPLGEAPTPPTATIGSVTYYASQTVNGCEGPRVGVTVQVNPVPAQPTFTAPAAVCQGTVSQPLSANGTALRWYGTNATGGTGQTNPTVPSTNTPGTTNYYVTQTVSGCESDRAAIPVAIKVTPAAPTLAASALEFCQGTQPPTLSATLVPNASVQWYTSATGGPASTTAPVLANTTPGTTTYYVGQTLDGCVSPRTSLSVRVNATPGAPGVSPVSFCNNAPAQVLTASGSNIKWYDANDGALNGTPTPNTGTVGDQVFKATQTSGEGCESAKASLTVTIKPLPGLPGVANLRYCQAQPDQPNQNVQPLTAVGQNLRWYNPDGNAYPNAPTPGTSQIGVQTFNVSQNVNGCEGGKAALQVEIVTTPAPVVPKPVVSYCVDQKAAPLEAIAESGAKLQWFDPSNIFRGEQAPVPPTLNANVDPQGDRYQVLQIGQNGCYSARSSVRVIVNTAPTLALTGSADVNLGEQLPLRLTFTGTAPYSYTLSGGYTGVARTADTTLFVQPRGNTTYQVLAVANGCGLGLPGNPATAIVTVRVPTVTTSALTTSTLCAGTQLSIPFTTTGAFATPNAFGAELATVADTAKKVDIPVSASATGSVLATLPGTLSGGQYYVRVKASNSGVGIVGSNSPTLLTVLGTPSATLTGTQTIYEGVPASLTVTLVGAGPWTLTYADSVRSYSATATTNPYPLEVRPTKTNTYRLTGVANVCGTGPVSGTATVSVLAVLGVDNDPLEAAVKAYPVPTGPTLTVDVNLPLSRNPAVLTLTDLRGRIVLERLTRDRQTQLDLSERPAGLYLLRVQVGDRQTMRKILKN